MQREREGWKEGGREGWREGGRKGEGQKERERGEGGRASERERTLMRADFPG